MSFMSKCITRFDYTRRERRPNNEGSWDAGGKMILPQISKGDDSGREMKEIP
jgi:hypothetical protein